MVGMVGMVAMVAMVQMRGVDGRGGACAGEIIREWIRVVVEKVGIVLVQLQRLG